MTKETITARVTEVQRERYTLKCSYGEVSAVLKGSFFNTQTDYPVIGDYVELLYNASGDSVICSVRERKSTFLRANLSGHAAGYVKTVKGQAIAANFDYVFIVTSLNQNFNINRIGRYISTTIQGNATPVVLLTKSDLCDNPEEYIKKVKELSPQTMVIAISAVTGTGLEELKPYLTAGTTIVLLGSSGVGKSTLVNTLAGNEIMKVSAIREEDGRGRHTTTHRELFTLPSGVTIIDTPGIRELGMFEAEEGLLETFRDITELEQQCKFRNCTHKNEPGCAINAALSNGQLSEKRWGLYLKLQEETAWGRRKAALPPAKKRR